MLSFQDCDLVLLNYERPSCVQQIINYNQHLPWKRILVADQQRLGRMDGAPGLHSISDDVLLWDPEHSLGSLARFMAPTMADSTFVCTQDDEYLVTEDGWLRLFEEWDNESIVAFQPTREFSAAGWLAEIAEQPVEYDVIQNTDLGYGAIYRNEWAIWCHERMTQAGFSEQCQESSDKAWTTFWGDAVRVPIEGVRRLLMPDFSYADNTSQVSQCKNIQSKQKEAIKAAIKARYDLFRSGTPGAYWFRTELHS